jgi:hypothetical protein
MKRIRLDYIPNYNDMKRIWLNYIIVTWRQWLRGSPGRAIWQEGISSRRVAQKFGTLRKGLEVAVAKVNKMLQICIPMYICAVVRKVCICIPIPICHKTKQMTSKQKKIIPRPSLIYQIWHIRMYVDTYICRYVYVGMCNVWMLSRSQGPGRSRCSCRPTTCCTNPDSNPGRFHQPSSQWEGLTNRSQRL